MANADPIDLFIKDAIVVTANLRGDVFEGGALAVSGRDIVAVGPSQALAHLEARARRIIDGRGMLLMPGIINMHSHAAASLFRGLVENKPLDAWLQRVWKAEKAILSPITTRLGAQLGFAEQALAGVTTVMDNFWFPDEAVAAANEIGLRICTGGMFFDPPGMDGLDQGVRPADAKAFLARHAGSENVIAVVMPHGAYTVSPNNLKLARAIADDHGALLSLHAAESTAELDEIKRRYGRTVIRHLDYHGLLNERTVLAHCVHLDDEEIAILARHEVVVAHNPVSNLKLASGIARVPDMLDAGVRVTLGTDGPVSGNDMDPWLALRLAGMLHKGANQRADAVSTHQALAMMTRTGGEALGMGARIGTLDPGKLADMVLLDVVRPHAVPMFDPVTHVVFSAAKSDVRHVFVGGRQIVHDGTLMHMDVIEIARAVQALAPTVAASI